MMHIQYNMYDTNKRNKYEGKREAKSSSEKQYKFIRLEAIRAY